MDNLERTIQLLGKAVIKEGEENSYSDSFKKNDIKVEFDYWGDFPDDSELKEKLKDEAISRALEMIEDGYKEGELNFEDDDYNIRGWWKNISQVNEAYKTNVGRLAKMKEETKEDIAKDAVAIDEGSKEEFFVDTEELDEANTAYGYNPKNPKIDIYVNGEYKSSTNWSPTLKLAKEKYLEKNKEVKPETVTTKIYKR